jgi:serine/threonine protein kinase
MDSHMIGAIIRDRYKLIDIRGRGSFATVYVARALEDNRIYAVKVMHLEYASNSELIARFQREAHILSKLNDSHIVRIVDHENDDDIHYIVMDYIDGQCLKYYMVNQRPLEPSRALRYAHQITEGLDIAYKQGVVHRDIKPQNILINTKDVVKITDFGLARGWGTVTLTDDNVFLGTPYYISPEQAKSGRSADIRSDLYSVAAVVFEMLTGVPPYEAETAVDIVTKHMTAKIPSICRRNPSLPPQMDLFMQKALAKSPADRYATPQDFIAALEELQVLVQPMPPGSVVLSPVIDADTTVVPAPEAKLVLLSNGHVFPLKGTQMLVGREDPKLGIYPEILLPDPHKSVGRKHAYLRNQQGKYTVEDLNARNKTRLNEVTLIPHQERTLKDGDILRFGRVKLRFELR